MVVSLVLIIPAVLAVLYLLIWQTYVLRQIPQPTEYIFYCKSAILFLSSSKILTPHPPLRPASVYPPPLLRREDRLAGRRGGWGGQYFGRREKQDCPLTVKYVLCDRNLVPPLGYV
jgi:hypothetical protein